MTIQTRAALLVTAALIRDAVIVNENTAARVGGYCYDLLDSMLLQSEMRAPTAKCVATTNVNPLSGLTTSADGITASADGVDVILLTGQSTASQNGPWVVAAGSWSRPSWFPVGGNAGGVVVTVQQGTIHAESQWQCTADDPSAVIGTNNLAWRRQGVGYYSATLAIIGDLNYCTGQRFRVIAGAGSDFIWTIGASDRMQLLNSSELLIYRGGDPTTYNDLKTTATGFELSSVVAGGTANVYLSGTGTTAALGNSTVSATSSVIATAAGTVNLDVGANHALAITASAQTFRIGANTVASLAAATATWGNATNVTTADLAASTTLHGYVGANAAWTAGAAFHTWKLGAVAALNIIDTELKHYGSDVTNYTRLTTGAASSTFARITAAGTANAFLMSTATEVHLGDSINTQTVDFLAAAAADTFQWFKGGALQADLDDGGFTVYDSAAATQWTLVAHDGITCSKDLTAAAFFKMQDATGTDVGQHIGIEGSSTANPNTYACGNVYLWAKGQQTAFNGSILLQVGDTPYTAIECILSSTTGNTTKIGLNGATPVAKGDITGARDDGTALASLLTYLASRGDLLDNTTAT